MSSSEVSAYPFVFGAIPLLPAEVDRLCAFKTQERVSMIAASLEAESPLSSEEYCGVESYVCDQADEALSSGDTDAFLYSLRLYGRLPDAVPYEIVRLCLSAEAMGISEATEFLTVRLAAEQESATRLKDACRAKVARPPYEQFRYTECTPMLSAVMRSYAGDDAPTDRFKPYFVDDYHAWTLQVGQCEARLCAVGQPDNEASIRIHKLAEALLAKAEPVASPYFVYAKAFTILQHIADPELRSGVRERYIETVRKMKYNDIVHMGLVGAMALDTLDDPSSDTSQLDFFEAWLGGSREIFQKTDPVLGKRAREIYREWQMRLLVHNDTEPSQIVAFLDKDIRAELINQPDEGERILMERDFTLREYAIRYARKGRLSIAQAFMQEMGGSKVEAEYIPDIRESTLWDCLAYADEQTVNDLMPSELARLVHPVLDRLVQARTCLAEADAQKVSEQALALLSDESATDNEVIDLCIRELHGKLQTINRSEARNLAETLITQMRGADADYSSIAYLSRYLILAGDIQEPQRAYEQIMRTQRNWPEWLGRLAITIKRSPAYSNYL